MKFFLAILVILMSICVCRKASAICENTKNIVDLELTAKSYETVELGFTVPCGGDAWPVSYDVRYNTSEITFGRRGNWRYSTSVSAPAPGTEGEKQSFTVSGGLNADTEYYFAIVTTFSDGSISYSNSPSVFTLADGEILVSLKWDPPTTNEDGTPLTDLAGYKVYYGPNSREYTYAMDVGMAETVSFIVQETDWIYWAVTAYDYYGNESEYSNEVSYP